MSSFLSYTVTLLVIKHTITPEHCTNIVPLSDKLYEAGYRAVDHLTYMYRINYFNKSYQSVIKI